MLIIFNIIFIFIRILILILLFFNVFLYVLFKKITRGYYGLTRPSKAGNLIR